MAVYTRTFSTRGRITIPAEIRQLLGVKQGDCVELVQDKGDIVLRRVQKTRRLQINQFPISQIE
jgi:AbrB family looped-hinge helix DNA binding protein